MQNAAPICGPKACTPGLYFVVRQHEQPDTDQLQVGQVVGPGLQNLCAAVAWTGPIRKRAGDMVRHDRLQLVVVICAVAKRCEGVTGTLLRHEHRMSCSLPHAARRGGRCSTHGVPPRSDSSPSDTGRSSGVVKEAHCGSPIQRGSVEPGRCVPIMLRMRSADHAAAYRCKAACELS